MLKSGTYNKIIQRIWSMRNTIKKKMHINPNFL
jgi:hypothetical protein